jgi:hypothetical protein
MDFVFLFLNNDMYTLNMSQPEITEDKEFEIDLKTREAQQGQESKKDSKASPWKFPRKKD